MKATQGANRLFPTLPRTNLLEPLAIGGDLCTVSANSRAAPSAPMATCTVREYQRAMAAFASLYIREFFFAHEFSQRLSDDQQQGFGRAPHRPPPERGGLARIVRHDLDETRSSNRLDVGPLVCPVKSDSAIPKRYFLKYLQLHFEI
jgi:hypothetical protein